MIKRTIRFIAFMAVLFFVSPVIGDDDVEFEDLEVLSQQIASMQQQIDELKAQQVSLSGAESVEKTKSKKDASFYMPQFSGVVMATFGVSAYNGDCRFNVRNARFSIKGNASDAFSYAMQVDFHNQGSVSMLDAYVKYKAKNFSLSLGQQHVMVTVDITRGPNANLFTSRSYAAIFAMSYYDGGTSVTSLGSRDIGAYALYKFSVRDLPFTIGLGAFNGNGMNKPSWDNNINISTRLTFGGDEGLSGGASLYSGYGNTGTRLNLWSAELRYVKNALFIESVYQQRRAFVDSDLNRLQVALVQGYYNIYTPKSKILDHLAPTVRWDIGNNLDYALLDENGSFADYEMIDAQRLTSSINFGLKGGKIRSRISVSYEKVFLKDGRPADMDNNPLLNDKFTVGFTAAF